MFNKALVIFFLSFCVLWAQEHRVDSCQFLGANLIGNNKTKEVVVFRELPWEVGSWVSLSDSAYFIKRIHDNIYNTGLFNFVTVKWVPASNGFYLVIELVERGYVWAYPLFELADPNLKSWWEQPDRHKRMSIGLEAQLKNIGGLNQRLFVYGQLGYRNVMGVHYKIPFLFGLKNIGWQVRVSYENKREVQVGLSENKRVFETQDHRLYEGFSFHQDIFLRPHLYHWFTLSLGYSRNKLNRPVSTLNQKPLLQKQNQQLWNTFLKYEWDKRDLKFYSRNGYYVSVESKQLYNLNYGLNLMSADLKSYNVYHQPFLKKWIWSQSILFYYDFKPEKDYFFYKGLGYAENLRGFEVKYFDAYTYWVNRNQLSYLLYKNDYISMGFIKQKKISDLHLAILLNGFFETGQTYQKERVEANSLSNELLMTCGIGLDFATYYDRTFRIEGSYNSLHQFNFNIHYKKVF